MAHVMHIVAIVAQKGGTGKSTVAANLAVSAARAGLRTQVVDADPQGSLVDWKRARGADTPTVLAAKPSAIHPMRFAAERAGVDFMVIDTRASALDNSLEAAKAAHLTLVVVRPTAIDLRAIAATVEALRPLRRPAAFLLNQAPSARLGREPALVSQAVDQLLGYGLPIVPVGLRDRAVYQGAFRRGRSPQEVEPRGAAAAELAGLWSYVAARLRQPAPPPRPALVARPRPAPPHALAARA
jgi:chromosome partitioning protein